MAIYCDSSALVKLLRPEPESVAFLDWITERSSDLVTSALTRLELIRAVKRAGMATEVEVDALLESFDVLDLSDSVLRAASALDPATLRSLDAIHLATALRLTGEKTVVVTYDHRFSDACALHGLP